MSVPAADISAKSEAGRLKHKSKTPKAYQGSDLAEQTTSANSMLSSHIGNELKAVAEE